YLNRIALLMVGSAYAAISAFISTPDLPEFAWYQLYPYIFLGLIIAATGLTLSINSPSSRSTSIAMGVLFAMAAAHVAIFGSFNPVMRASDIMNPVDTPLVRQWRELYELNGRAPLAIDGNYGHLLRGE